MGIINLNNVSFSYSSGDLAVDNISLDILEGSKIAIIGQNGAGKTTTVKLMNGLLKPSVGDVIIDGLNTKNYSVAKLSKKIGYVFQNPDDQIFQNTIYKEIEFGPKKMGLDEKNIKKNVEYASEIMMIKELWNEHPYNVPLSIRKLVAIASVVSMNPKVLILDEPTAGQDYKGMSIICNLLEALRRDKKTVITITHDMEFVSSNFDNIIVMANHKIIRRATAREIFSDIELLKASKIRQPYITELGNKIKIKEDILTIDEFISCIKDKITKKINPL